MRIRTALPRSSGVLLHFTSLPGPLASGDLGAGARHFIDWLAHTRQRYWQVLPVGPKGGGNSPYLSPSTMAGDPALIDWRSVRDSGWISEDEWYEWVASPAPAPACAERVDYSAADAQRRALLGCAWRRFQASARADEKAAFQRFCDVEASWLDDYALFTALHEHFSGVSWIEWPPALAARESAALAAMRVALSETIGLWQFAQWLFAQHWQALADYAQSKGVVLIGDLPLYPGHDSVDVWTRPELYALATNGSPAALAGVPPDRSGRWGQCWGAPVYQWAAHAAEGYAWWCARVRQQLRRFGLLRIDHFRGIEAFWAINPLTANPADGQWRSGPGEALLAAIDEACCEPPLFVEDLGYMTPAVTALRKRFRLPGIAVLQMGFYGDPRNRYLPHLVGPDTVIYTATHDHNTTRGWLQAEEDFLPTFLYEYLGLPEGANIETTLLALQRSAMMSAAGLVITPLQDLLQLGAQSRMNTPGQASGCWEWRFEWSALDDAASSRLRSLTELSSRASAP